MLPPYLTEPSRAELMERVRAKIKQNCFVLHPDVSDYIARLRDLKRLLSQKQPDGSHVTITTIDLTNALCTGVARDIQECVDCSGWMVVVNGTSMDGVLLTVSVYLPPNDADDSPLVIMSFDLLPEAEITGFE